MTAAATEPVKMILFDNDGVLVDTERLYFDANRIVLGEIGIALSSETYIDLFLKHSHGLQKLTRDAGMSPEETESLRMKRNAVYSGLLEKGAEVLPGVPETLELLSARYRMAIVTSAYRKHFDIIHQRTGLRRFFEFVVTVEDFSKWKPDPEPYIRAVAKSGVPTERCIAVEDSERGLISAAGAGLRCVMVPHDLTRNQDFSRAWAVLDRIDLVPAFLDRGHAAN